MSGKRAPVSSALRPKAAEASGQGFATRTTYYAAFQTGDGNRMEFQVSQADYNRLAEGNRHPDLPGYPVPGLPEGGSGEKRCLIGIILDKRREVVG